MMITLKNTFHNTQCRVRGQWTDPQDAWFSIQYAVYAPNRPSKAAVRRLRRVWKALCGIEGCTCGTVR